MSANIKATNTEAIIGVGGVDQMKVSNAGVVTANSFVGAISGNASSATALATGSSTARSLANRFGDVVNAKDFGAIGDGASHPLSSVYSTLAAAQAVYPFVTALTQEIDGVAIQAAIDVQKGPVFLPNGIYLVSSEIVIKDGTGIIGENPFWKRRTGYVYTGDKNTVIKYVGAGGTNSCVIRASKKAVGLPGTSFNPITGDDLTNIQLKNFHVDANGLADYAFYFYRAGNCGNVVDCITSEKAAKDNVLFLGMFAGYFGIIAAYQAVGRGIVVAEDIFNWESLPSPSSEWNCYNFSATFIAANNGTSNTFVENTLFTNVATDGYNCGIYIGARRGSKFRLSSEGNFGRSLIVDAANQGPLLCYCDYFEGNGAGPLIKNYSQFSGGVNLDMGFLFPIVNPATATINPENIKIFAASTEGGPPFTDAWLKINDLIGQTGFSSFNINSNTTRFKVNDSSGGIQYPTKRPQRLGVIGKGYFKGDSTLSDVRYIRGDTIINSFWGNGTVGPFTLDYAPTNQAQTFVYVNGNQKTVVTQYTITGTTLTFTTGNAPASGDQISVSYSNMTLTRVSAGIYQVTFNVAQPNAEYAVSVTNVQINGQATASAYSLTTTGFFIRTSTVAAPTVLSDNSDYINFIVVR